MLKLGSLVFWASTTLQAALYIGCLSVIPTPLALSILVVVIIHLGVLLAQCCDYPQDEIHIPPEDVGELAPRCA